MIDGYFLDIGGQWYRMSLEEWLEKNVTEGSNSGFDADAVTALYLKIRRKKAERKKEFDTWYADATADQEKLEGMMKDFLDQHGLKSAPSANGVFYKKVDIKPSAADWTVFYEWIKETNQFEFLHKRISVEAVKAYMEEHKDDEMSLPPGINVLKEYVVRVRTGKGEE